MVFEGADLFVERASLALVGSDDVRWRNDDGDFSKLFLLIDPKTVPSASKRAKSGWRFAIEW